MEAESSEGSSHFSRRSSGSGSDSEGRSQRGTKKRGRGRARGAGGRAKGAGRRARGAGGRAKGVQYGPALPTRADRAQMLRQERDEQLRERVSQLTDEGRQDCSARLWKHIPICIRHPYEVNRGTTGGYHPAPGVTARTGVDAPIAGKCPQMKRSCVATSFP